MVEDVPKRGPGRLSLLLLVLVVAVAAIVPSMGTMDAGLISEDGAALAYVDQHPLLADFTGPQYDLRTFRFWRPLVTAGLDLQHAVVGVDPFGLRLFNLACHALAAMLLMVLALRLGLPPVAALVAGVLAGLFPYQGGTVTWMIGRTEVQTLPLVLACLIALAGRSRWWAALWCALALASKENAAVLPGLAVVVVAARWWVDGRGGGRAGDEPQGLRPLSLLAPTLVTFAVVFALRAHLIGHWIGGYPGGLSGVLGTSSVIDLVVSSVRAVLGSLGWLLVGLGGALLMALVARARDNSAERDRPLAVVLVGLAGLALCLAPVVTNLIPGEVAAEHQRTLYFADLFGCLGVGALVLAAARLGHGASLGAGLVLLALVGQRGHAAWVDTHDWARAGDEAEHLVGQARLLVGSLPPSDLPVLVTAPPPAVDGCYLLKFGVPDRFRAPFPVTPRPIWPWGEIFPTPGQQREAAVEVVNHVRLPLDTGPTLAPVLPLSVRASGHAGPAVVVGDGGAVTAELSLTPALVDGLVAGTEDHRSLEYPYLELPAATATGHLEALVISEQGYGTGLRPGAVDGPIPLGELLALPLGDGSGGQRLLDVISWTADLRATEAWLELRLVSDEGELLAASRWLHLVWDRDLRDHLLPWDSF